MIVVLTVNEQFFSYIMARTSYICRDYDLRFILDQHTWLDFHSATSSLKQQSSGRHGRRLSKLFNLCLILLSF